MFKAEMPFDWCAVLRTDPVMKHAYRGTKARATMPHEKIITQPCIHHISQLASAQQALRHSSMVVPLPSCRPSQRMPSIGMGNELLSHMGCVLCACECVSLYQLHDVMARCFVSRGTRVVGQCRVLLPRSACSSWLQSTLMNTKRTLIKLTCCSLDAQKGRRASQSQSSSRCALPSH